MQLTLHATRRSPHGASRLVRAMSTWLAKTRRAPSRHCWDARVCDHKTSAVHDMSTPTLTPGIYHIFPCKRAKVLRTRSTSGMYLPLSITITAAAILWATYGFMTLDWFVAAPQSVGFLAGVAQLSLFLRSERERAGFFFFGFYGRCLSPDVQMHK